MISDRERQIDSSANNGQMRKGFWLSPPLTLVWNDAAIHHDAKRSLKGSLIRPARKGENLWKVARDGREATGGSYEAKGNVGY